MLDARADAGVEVERDGDDMVSQRFAVSVERSPSAPSDRIYVSWTEQWDVARNVEHYIGERKLRASDELRATLRQRIARYPWPGRCANGHGSARPPKGGTLNHRTRQVAE